MFAARLAARAPRVLRASAMPAPLRTLRTSAVLRSDAPAPIIVYEGAKPGQVATDEQQATGLERWELENTIEGKPAFDMEPLPADRLGTVASPISVLSLFPTRIIGCTGSPAGAHDTIWLHLNREIKNHRCPECGSVYTMDFQGDEHAEHH